MKKNIIDLTSFKELYDEDGDLLFEDNLTDLFEYLQENNLLKDKKQKYIFWVSKVLGGQDDPYRDARERTGTIRKLSNYWKNTFGKPFSSEFLVKLYEKRESRIEDFVQQGRKEHAWGVYSAHVRHQNEIREYQKADKLPEKEKEKEISRLKNRPNHLVIG
ncbi:MAG: hypothetical protein QG594_1960 [Bacteroidota bacterium]|nr:hypothetical protein [Bacteroidota bacterium]